MQVINDPYTSIANAEDLRRMKEREESSHSAKTRASETDYQPILCMEEEEPSLEELGLGK